MSVASLLSIARTALFAQQAAMEVTSHNIANADTEGYSRQRIRLEAAPANVLANLTLGAGVFVGGVDRARDAFLDASVRSSTSSGAGQALRRDALQQLEGIANEPSDSGLAATLDRFWNAWSDLATNPSGQTERVVVRQRGAQLASVLNEAAGRVTELKTQLGQHVDLSLTSLNTMTTRVAQLNGMISTTEAGGGSANDLRDQRDAIIDSISKLVPVNIAEDRNGQIRVSIGGIPLVDGITSTDLTRQTIAGTEVLATASGLSPITVTDGEIGAALGLGGGELADMTTRLSQLGSQLVSVVNGIHTQGWTSASSGVEFFDSAAWASTGKLALAAPIVANASAIASGSTVNASGDNTLALAMSGLRSTTQAGLGGGTFATYWRDSATAVGSAAAAAEDEAALSETLTANAQTRRQSLIGVSTDEELTNLIRSQQSYAAAARLVRTADEMSKTLLEMV